MKRHIVLCCLCLLGSLPMASQADSFDSPYDNMRLTFSFQGFDPGLNDMELIGDNLWRRDFEITNTVFDVLFVADADFDTSWKDGNQPHERVPLASVATPSGSDIRIVNNSGNSSFRFLFNDQTLAYSIFLLNNTGTNLLYNPGFEERGSLSSRAEYWQYNRPTRHGDFWGNARRAQQSTAVQPRSGVAVGSIVGANLAQGNTNGGFWQDVPVEPGLEYELVMYYRRAATQWQADVKEIKIEFFDFHFGNPLEVHTLPFEIQPVGADWPSVRLPAVAPAGAAWARVVLNFEGIGTTDSLWIDDLSFAAIEANRIQDFNQWTGAEFDGCHSFSGWRVCTGRVVATETTVIDGEPVILPVARTGLAASLNGGGSYIRSPRFDSVGSVRLWYRNGSLAQEGSGGDPIVVAPVEFQVQTSIDGISWITQSTVSDITTLSYVPHQTFVNIVNPRFVRIIQSAGTNRLLIDDLEITEGGSNPRYQPFEGWPGSASTPGVHSHQNWLISGGRVTTEGAKEGHSAEIQGHTSELRFVQSPLFNDGFGEISFSYARGNTGVGPAALRLEYSPNGTDWTSLAYISNITTRAYSTFSSTFYEPGPAFIRIVNEYAFIEEDVSVVLIEEGFDGGSTPPTDWSFPSGIGTYTTTFVPNQPALQFNANSSGAANPVVTPNLTNPTNVQFYVRRAGGNNDSSFLVQHRVGGNWITTATVNPIPTAGTVFSFPLPSNTEQLRFIHDRAGAGNMAFDDVVIHGFADVDQPAQSLMLDDIDVRRAREFRNQDFDTWPDSNSLGDHEFQGWSIQSGLVRSEFAFSGNAAQLQTSASGYFVDFEGEGETKTSYGRIDVDLNGRVWAFQETLIGTFGNDMKTGDRAARFRHSNVETNQATMTLLTDLENGIGTLSLLYARSAFFQDRDPDAPTAVVEYSTNGGNTWLQAGSPIHFDGVDELTTFSVALNEPSPARVRIRSISGTEGRRFNIDEIEITDYAGASGPAATISSPVFPTGIGSISFRYRHRLANPVGDEIITLQIDTSGDGEVWTERGQVVVDSAEYDRFFFFVPELEQTDSTQMRIRLIAGDGRAVIDDIQVGPPRAPASIIIRAGTDPETPFTNDSVRIVSQVVRRNGADDVELTLHYRFGSDGPFTNSTMALESGVFISDVEFPPLPRGSRVEYYIEAQFEGPGASSPVFHPAAGASAPAFYVIPRAQPGSVWINEVNFFMPSFDPTFEFIELAGQAGTDIGGWSILVQSGVSPNFAVLGYYVIPEATVIQNQHQGYGFFVLAGGSAANLYDMALTNSISASVLGIRLFNEAGGIEQEWSFNSFITGYERGGNDDEDLFFGPDTSASVIGTGSLGDDFEWASDLELTPGAPNVGQTFDPLDPDPPPAGDIEIVEISFTPSLITIITDGNTGDWDLIPEYATHLVAQPQQWLVVPGFNDSPSGTENTITFAPPATNHVILFRIKR